VVKIEKKGEPKKRKAKDITQEKEDLEEAYNSEDELEVQRGKKKVQPRRKN